MQPDGCLSRPRRSPGPSPGPMQARYCLPELAALRAPTEVTNSLADGSESAFGVQSRKTLGAANAHSRWSQITTGPMPVVAESAQRTSPVCTRRPGNDSIIAPGRGRASDSNVRPEQRRESCHL